MPDFDDLPFDERPDLSRFLVHLTKNTKAKNGKSAYRNLLSILRSGKINGSTSAKGFIKGKYSATCFMDIPLHCLKYVLDRDNADPADPRYEACGVLVQKPYAYKMGCRPVLYLSNAELKKLSLPDDELWRVVRFEVKENSWISWLHEREWRCMGDFQLPAKPLAVVVRDTKHAVKLRDEIGKHPKKFKAKPKSFIPLTVLCEGLPYL